MSRKQAPAVAWLAEQFVPGSERRLRVWFVLDSPAPFFLWPNTRRFKIGWIPPCSEVIPLIGIPCSTPSLLTLPKDDSLLLAMHHMKKNKERLHRSLLDFQAHCTSGFISRLKAPVLLILPLLRPP